MVRERWGLKEINGMREGERQRERVREKKGAFA